MATLSEAWGVGVKAYRRDRKSANIDFLEVDFGRLPVPPASFGLRRPEPRLARPSPKCLDGCPGLAPKRWLMGTCGCLSQLCFWTFFMLFLSPRPTGGPGEGPDCPFLQEIEGFGPIPARIWGETY